MASSSIPPLNCHGLHPQTLSLAGIISKPLEIFALVIFSPLSLKVTLIIWILFLTVNLILILESEDFSELLSLSLKHWFIDVLYVFYKKT